MANEEKKYTEQVSVRWYGYIVLILTILFFSGIFSSAEGPIKALDFTNISGSFGSLGEITEDAGTLASDFRGTGGSGARDAWLFALTLVPAVMLALGVVKVVEHLDGLRAMDAGKPVEKVAVGGGACGSMLPLVQAMGCDTFVTSDLKHDLYLEARALGINLLDAGHYSTEAVVCPALAAWAKEAFPAVEVLLAERQGEVFQYL